MVVTLGPVKFYGSSLPRPRFYTDVKLSEDRIDPPLSILDPFLSWANEAHWSMGGHCFKRVRLQGKIEGNIKKLRAEQEKTIKKNKKKKDESECKDPEILRANIPSSVSPPAAPIITKRRRKLALVDEDSELEGEKEMEDDVLPSGVGSRPRRKLVRKLGADFDKVALESVANGGEKLKGFESNESLEIRGSPLKDKNKKARGNEEITTTPPSSNRNVAVASRTRSQRSEKVEDLPVEDLKGLSLKEKKLQGGKKAKTNVANGSPAGGIRTSPRLSKSDLKILDVNVSGTTVIVVERPTNLEEQIFSTPSLENNPSILCYASRYARYVPLLSLIVPGSAAILQEEECTMLNILISLKLTMKMWVSEQQKGNKLDQSVQSGDDVHGEELEEDDFKPVISKKMS
ncbi:hypothetical protein HHK36_001869 [Tetracentron sinense]|uniref:Uncharacterized protein n=1 Tax=Tetracentron sinense TaxID=13715 RepID=A0A834ZY91_TETSI|nr:hypothetical protein HHK36_001869 [Tetracentron sinense]